MMPCVETLRFVLVVPHRNGFDALRATLLGAIAAMGRDDALVVVDNASDDESVELLSLEFPSIHWVRNEKNLGFAVACNQGASKLPSRFLLFLNSDAIIPSTALDRLASFFEETPFAGEVGCRLSGADGRPQRATTRSPDLMSESGLRKRIPRGYRDPSSQVRVDALVGACVAMPRWVFDRVGGWDERFFFYEEDIDLSIRVRRAGLDVWYLPDIEVVHGRGVATRKVRLPAQLEAVRSRFRYIGKHFPSRSAAVLMALRFLSICLGAVGATAALITTLGLHRGARERAVRALVTLVWVLLLMRPRWSLSGRS